MALKQVSGVLNVEMEVTSCEEYPEDDMVQVWGHVGDYEVSVWLATSDPRLVSILGTRPARGRANRRNANDSR